MTFGVALERLKLGRKIARSGWNGKGMHLYLTRFEGFEPCIVMHTAQSLEQPGWLASQADMLSDDWECVSE